MRRPEIKEIDTTHYSGKADEEIRVTASKKGFTIQEVKMMIVDENGELVEEGIVLEINGFSRQPQSLIHLKS